LKRALHVRFLARLRERIEERAMWDNPALLRKIADTLFFLSVSALLLGIGFYLVHLPTLFPLNSVRLSAAPHRVSSAQVLEVVSSEVKGNLFTVDIAHLRQSLEKLQWVKSVNIRREFPGKLEVELEEHKALASWNNSLLVNMQGTIFSGSTEQKLPVFFGQAGDSIELAQRYTQFSSQLSVLNLQVIQVALSPRHAWQLHLSNGMVLELGREEMQQRLSRFVTAYPSSLAIQAGAARYVDMRYRNGFAVGGIPRVEG
jgi:cell division protein FtsQ